MKCFPVRDWLPHQDPFSPHWSWSILRPMGKFYYWKWYLILTMELFLACFPLRSLVIHLYILWNNIKQQPNMSRMLTKQARLVSISRGVEDGPICIMHDWYPDPGGIYKRKFLVACTCVINTMCYLDYVILFWLYREMCTSPSVISYSWCIYYFRVTLCTAWMSSKKEIILLLLFSKRRLLS